MSSATLQTGSIYNVLKVYCSVSGLVGGQEGELKAGSEVNMDEEGTPALNLPYPSSYPSLVSRILFYAV